MSEEVVQENDLAVNEEPVQKEKKLGYWTILIITINSIMGTGIFFLPAVGVREAGLFSIISWVIMGLVAIYFGMIFAELVGIYPKEGGVYEYAKMAFGSFPSFILGWMTFIAANVTVAMLIIGALKYVGPMLPNVAIMGIGILFILLFNFMAFKGMQTSAVMLVAFGCITLLTVGGILIPGLLSFDPGQFVGWLQHSAFTEFSFSGFGIIGISMIVFTTIFFIAETFFGWETATFLAEKVNNPKKIMPKVFVRATVAIAIIAFLVVIASLSLIHWSTLGASLTPLSDLASAVYGATIGKWYAVAVYLAIIGSVAGWIVASPNLLVALAKDKLFLPQMAKMHKKNKTPHKSILFQTIFTSLLIIIGAGNYETLLHLLVPLVLVLYASVVLSVLFIRKKYPDIQRPYVAPFKNWGPVVLILFSLVLIVLWTVNVSHAYESLLVLAGFVVFGFPIYLLLLFFYDPDWNLRFKNRTATITFFFERLFSSKKLVKKILQNSIIQNNVILELGAGSGLVSSQIAKRSPKEQIIIEQSSSLAKVIKKRAKGPHPTRVLVDEHLISRIHPDIQQADEIFSFGLLSDVQNIPHYLNELANVLPENGRIHFFDYVDLYKIIPNKEIFSNTQELEQLFDEAGFKIHIRKIKGLLWNYLLIDGIKTREDISFI